MFKLNNNSTRINTFVIITYTTGKTTGTATKFKENRLKKFRGEWKKKKFLNYYSKSPENINKVQVWHWKFAGNEITLNGINQTDNHKQDDFLSEIWDNVTWEYIFKLKL